MKTKQHTGVIYMLIAPTGERYIGRTVNYKRRMRDYRIGNTHGKVGKSIELHGWDNFASMRLMVGVADSALVSTETAFVVMLKPELNIMTNGVGGRLRHAESTKRKMVSRNQRRRGIKSGEARYKKSEPQAREARKLSKQKEYMWPKSGKPKYTKIDRHMNAKPGTARRLLVRRKKRDIKPQERVRLLV